MGNMQLYSAGGSSTGSAPDASALPPGGRLFVTPAYMQTTGDQAVQLNSTDKLAMFGWTQEADCAYTSLSLYIAAIGTQGNLTLQIYAADSSGDPTGEAMLDTTLASGAVADVWVRATFDAVQCYRKTRYILQVGIEGSVDVSLSCRRWNTANGSMFPDGAGSKTSADGGEIWADVTQDDKPALLNVVMGSSEHHCPQLVYGRYNGSYIPLYNEPAWGMSTIPEAGVFLDCEVFSANTGHVIGIADNDGTLVMFEDDDAYSAMQDGIKVFEGGPTIRIIGNAYVIERQAGYQAPIDVMDFRGIAYSGMRKRIGKLCPYSEQAAESAVVAANTPSKWNSGSDDFTVKFLAIDSTEVEITGGCLQDDTATSAVQVGCGIDTTSIPVDGWGSASHTFELARYHRRLIVPEGLHSCYSIRWLSENGTLAVAYFTTEGYAPDVRAEVAGVITA